MRKLIITILPFILLSCSSLDKASGGQPRLSDLVGSEWVLESLKGQAVTESDFMKGLPSLVFKEDGGLQGSTGCNSFTGNFTLGDALKLNPGVMTKMNCPGSSESDFLNALTGTTSLDLLENKLVLKNATNELLRFTSSKE